LNYDRTLPLQFYDAVLGINAKSVLNKVAPQTSQSRNTNLDVELRQCSAQIKAEAIDPQSGKVHYVQLKDSQAYRAYRQLSTLLPAFDLRTLETANRQKAFWLNLYNTLTIDGIIHYGLQRSVREKRGFFRRAAYHIGGYRFCLDDIEHGILRANAGHPFIPGPQFGPTDPRRQFSLNVIDWRIHFALVCGAVSCPPINFYDADKIDAQLDLATQSVLDQSVELDRQRCLVSLSKLMQWYGHDFGAGDWLKFGLGDRSVLLDVITTLIANDETRAFLQSNRDKLTIRFKPYNWTLNTA